MLRVSRCNHDPMRAAGVQRPAHAQSAMVLLAEMPTSASSPPGLSIWRASLQRFAQRLVMNAGHERAEVEGLLVRIEGFEARKLHGRIASRLQPLGCTPDRRRIRIHANNAARDRAASRCAKAFTTTHIQDVAAVPCRDIDQPVEAALWFQ